MRDKNVDTPLISVITVVFNAVGALEKTIQSVIGQRGVELEYVVIDGGSKDGTLAIVEKYHDAITTWISEPDNGIYDAMNKGVRSSHGEWLVFLNAGDTFAASNSLASLMKAALQAPELPDLVFGDALLVQPDGSAALMKMHNSLPFLIRHSLCHQSMFYNRTCFEKVGLFDTSYRLASDFDHLVRMKWQGAKIVKLDVAISRYPLDGLSAKPENISRIWKERMTIYSKAKAMPFLVRIAFWIYAKMAYEFRRKVR